MNQFVKFLLRGGTFFLAAALAADMAVARLYGQNLTVWSLIDFILLYFCAYFGWREDDKS